MLVNLDAWNELQPKTRALFDLACQAEVVRSFSEGEAVQGEIIRNFPSDGITAETLPDEILLELRKVAVDVLDEEAANDEHFRRILESQRAFSESYGYWKRKGYLPRDF